MLFVEFVPVLGSKKSQEKWESSRNKAIGRHYVTYPQEIKVYQDLEYCPESWPVRFKDGGDRGDVEKDIIK